MIQKIADYSNPKLIRALLNKIIISKNFVKMILNEKAVPKVLENLSNDEELNIAEKEIIPFIVVKKIELYQPSKTGNILIIPAKDNNVKTPNPYLVNALVKAHYYYKRLQEGDTIETLQTEEGFKDFKYIRNVLKLKFLHPKIMEDILNGTRKKI